VHSSVPGEYDPGVRRARAREPGQVFVRALGHRTGQHFAGELLKKMAGIDMAHVPYKGGGPAVQDLVAGQIPVGRARFDAGDAAPQVRTHPDPRVHEQGSPGDDARDPTLHESGFPGFDTTQWTGLLAPRGTSADIVNRLNAETRKALAFDDVRKHFAQASLVPVGNRPKEFDA
jgi:tripartite-type tricarboxylate transporter receptor subunit TctC